MGQTDLISRSTELEQMSASSPASLLSSHMSFPPLNGSP